MQTRHENFSQKYFGLLDYPVIPPNPPLIKRGNELHFFWMDSPETVFLNDDCKSLSFHDLIGESTLRQAQGDKLSW